MKLTRGVLAACFVALALLSAHAQSEPEPQGQDEPIDLDVVERTERRLIQLDVSFEPRRKGKAVVELPRLEAADFELVISGNQIPIRYADRVCTAEPGQPAPAAAGVAAGSETPAEPATAPALRNTYVFYIEHSLLTWPGQETALSMVEELIPELITNGARGMVVSSGRKLVQSELTADPDVLLETIGSVRKNTLQWTAAEYAAMEEDRIRAIFEAQREGQLERAASMARRFQLEEMMTTSNRLGRFAAVLGSLADLDPPKAVLYFADMLRQQPGRHYAEYVGSGQYEDAVTSSITMSAYSGAFAFDHVTEQAGALGVRLYTIKAKGLDAGSLGAGVAGGRTGGSVLPRSRVYEAEQTMDSLALETGGASFFGGTQKAALGKVLDRIHDDLKCFYLLSFYPEQLPLDVKLPVRVRFNQDSARFAELNEGFDIATRGQLVVMSESKRQQSILLAAHVSDTAIDATPGRGVVIPIAYADNRYQALVQLMVTNPDLPPGLTQGLSWDLGMTHEFREQVENQVASHVEVRDPTAPVVLEALWSFKPGTSKVVSVAHESRFGQVATAHRDWEWPDPNGEPAVVSPIAVVQPASGVFVRKDGDQEQTRARGSLGIGEGAAFVDRPAYMISLVCRSKKNRDDLWIDRKLVGSAPIDFELQQWSASDGERCVQFRDLIRQGVMGWGVFTYEVSVYDNPSLDGEPLARRVREFVAVDPAHPVEAQVLEDAAEDQPIRKVDPLALPDLGSD